MQLLRPDAARFHRSSRRVGGPALLAALVTVLLNAAAVMPAWAGGGGGSLCSGFGDTDTILLRDFCVAPAATIVPRGAPTRVMNDGAIAHDLTAVDGSFTTGLLQPGGAVTINAPSVPGVYRLYCTLHGSEAGEGMTGLLIVGDAATPVTDAAITLASGGGGASAGSDGVSTGAAVADRLPLGVAGVALALALGALGLGLSTRRGLAVGPAAEIQQ